MCQNSRRHHFELTGMTGDALGLANISSSSADMRRKSGLSVLSLIIILLLWLSLSYVVCVTV